MQLIDMRKNFEKPNGSRPRSEYSSDPSSKTSAAKPPKEVLPKLSVNLYGVHAVTHAWNNPNRKIKSLYITENAAESVNLPKTEGRPLAQLVNKTQLDRALPDSVHQGVAVFAHPLDEVFLQDLLIQDKGVIVMLDQVTDPHNIGAILRSANVFGALGVVVQSRHAPELDGLISKVACGAAEYTPLVYETNLNRALTQAKDHGWFIVGMDERGTAETQDYAWPEKTLLVLGAEGKGLRHLIRENCEALVRLPTCGQIPSLNVSNAAAITLYAMTTYKG
jgi:23S rRNA (guanosine2251-2'-O)-methyltransferase